jgi:hypothetical protein
MANEEQLKILLKGVQEWNAWRAEHPKTRINLNGAPLGGRDLRDADLSNAELIKACLNRADLRDTNLSRADLRGADLHKAKLQDANLSKARLWRADLSQATLIHTDCGEANLKKANLCGADLWYTNFIKATLEKANLKGANLRKANLKQANLIEANLNGVTLTNTCLWETQRAGWSIVGIICEAVYWDRNWHERTLYSPGEFERLYADHTKIVLHYEGGINPIEIATLPALIQRIEATHPGCVLRLHSVQEGAGGATVTLIVDAPSGSNPEELAALKAELEEQGRRLLSAERKALEEEAQRLHVEHTLRYLSHEVLPRLLESGRPNYSISITGRKQTMGDTYIAGQVGAQGPHAHAHDINFHQLWSYTGQSLDLPALATQLATLRQHLRQEAVKPEHDIAIGAVANAEVAAKEGNGPKTLEFLSKAGQWTLDNATKIGVGIATAALKTALGL